MPNNSIPLVVGFGGSGRAGSSTERALELALRGAEAAGARTRIFGGEFLYRLPLYNAERPGRTEEEQELLSAIREADGLIIGTPAYHGSLSGAVKNAIDLIEDTARDERAYLDGRAVGLIVTSYGWQATGATLSALRSIVHALRGWPTPLGAGLNASGGLFNEDGTVKESAVADCLSTIGRQVVRFASRSGA